jgi:hypothetical protein
MATRHDQGGAQALPTFNLADTVGQKVVRLPTALNRQPRQKYNRWTREAKLQLREQQSRTFPYMVHGQREALARIKRIRAATGDAADLARRVLDAMTADEARRVAALINAGNKAGDPLAVEAHQLLAETVGRTNGEVNDFLWVMSAYLEA